MSMDAIERFEMIFGIGSLIISILFYVVLGIVFLVVSSKKKQTDPKDAKTWKIVGIVCFAIAGFVVLVTIGTFVLAEIASNLSASAVFIM